MVLLRLYRILVIPFNLFLVYSLAEIMIDYIKRPYRYNWVQLIVFILIALTVVVSVYIVRKSKTLYKLKIRSLNEIIDEDRETPNYNFTTFKFHYLTIFLNILIGIGLSVFFAYAVYTIARLGLYFKLYSLDRSIKLIGLLLGLITSPLQANYAIQILKRIKILKASNSDL